MVTRLHLPWRAGRFLVFVAFGLLPALLWSASVTAAPVGADEGESCLQCHSIETMTWEQSPHAVVNPETGAPSAVCTDCHGVYTAEHPENDLMEVDVSSATCSNCHATTSSQWQGTVHAQAGVQCIGCHQAHSQDLRLSTQELCVSCHSEPREDIFHTAHWLGDVTCVNCHLADQQPAGELASSDAAMSVLTVPTHDFVTVSGRNCLDCHRTDVQATAWAGGAREQDQARLLDKSHTTALLANKLDATEANLRTFQMLTPMAMGLGVGLGGMLGIIFMLVASRKESTPKEES